MPKKQRLFLRILLYLKKTTANFKKSRIFITMITLIDKETLEREEQEAREWGVSVLRLRQIKKMHETRKKQGEKKRKLEEKKKERQREQKRIKDLKKLQKEEEKKERIKEKKRLKREKMLLEHPKKKRHVGRPKKRGPKKKYKKKKKPIPKPPITWDYKIVSCRNGRQNAYIDRFKCIEDAYEKLNQLVEESKNVIFPSKVLHGNCGAELVDTKYEYLLLERIKKEKKVSLLRNDFGKLVEQRSNSQKWNIIDKKLYYVEETFWVWGFNNRTDRKTFPWIYENIIVGRIQNAYDVKRVLLYKNKIIIKNDDETMDIIFCKTKSDAFRFYELLESFIKRDKIKQVFFIGSYDIRSDKREKLIQDLMKMTGWTKKKVQMSSTSEHKSQKLLTL